MHWRWVATCKKVCQCFVWGVRTHQGVEWSKSSGSSRLAGVEYALGGARQWCERRNRTAACVTAMAGKPLLLEDGSGGIQSAAKKHGAPVNRDVHGAHDLLRAAVLSHCSRNPNHPKLSTIPQSSRRQLPPSAGKPASSGATVSRAPCTARGRVLAPGRSPTSQGRVRAHMQARQQFLM